jgi:hypothetical protein
MDQKNRLNMNDRLDKFFKARLTDYTMAPTPGAWSKVEANLSKKNSGIVWLRAAAALLILGLSLATIVWVQSRRNETTPTSITKVDTSQEKEAVIKELNKEEELRPTLKRSSGSIAKRQPTLAQVENRPETVLQESQEIEQHSIVESTTIIDVTESIAVSQPKAKKPLVLEFRLEEIPTREQLPEGIEVATIDSKNGIQKALGFALEVKNGESPIINFRQAKETLFALNFKKDKKTTTQQ